MAMVSREVLVVTVPLERFYRLLAVVVVLEVGLPLALVVVEAALLVPGHWALLSLLRAVFLVVFILVEQHSAITLEAEGRLLHLIQTVLLPNLAGVAVLADQRILQTLLIVVGGHSMVVLVAEVAGVLYFFRVVGFIT
jgi:hypothetical protein